MPAPVSISVINPTLNEVPDEKPFNIFEYIGRPTAEREVRKKQDMKGKKMGKMDALKMLMSIAGDSWEKDLLMGSKDDKMSGGHSGTLDHSNLASVDFFYPFQPLTLCAR